MGFFDFLAGANPSVAIGEAAGGAVSKVIDSVGKIIDDLNTSDEEKSGAKLKLIEAQIEFRKAELLDIQSARQMQMSTKSWWPGFLSFIVLTGFFGGGTYIMIYGLPVDASIEAKNIVNMFAVSLIGSVSAVIGFWLGSSNGSQNKDAMIYNSVPVKKE